MKKASRHQGIKASRREKKASRHRGIKGEKKAVRMRHWGGGESPCFAGGLDPPGGLERRAVSLKRAPIRMESGHVESGYPLRFDIRKKASWHQERAAASRASGHL